MCLRRDFLKQLAILPIFPFLKPEKKYCDIVPIKISKDIKPIILGHKKPFNYNDLYMSPEAYYDILNWSNTK